MTDQPDRPMIGEGAPVLSVDGFEGPLDWLLDLAREGRIDLARLPILALVTAFADALAASLPRGGPHALRDWARWLVMASDLVWLRSRLLLPADDATASQVDGAPSTALRDVLRDKAQVAAAADWLSGRRQLGRDVFGRGVADTPAAAGQRDVDVIGLLRACLVVLAVPADAAWALRPTAGPFWTAADAMARIRHDLAALGGDGATFEHFLPPVEDSIPDRDLRCRSVVASTFLGGLELARLSELSVHQDGETILMAPPAP